MPSTLLVAHDAGGAEILSAWQAEQNYDLAVIHCLAGPALRIFERDNGPLPRQGLEVMDDLAPGSLVLTGTSLEADLERRAIARAGALGLHCVSFLDHWDLYRERFGPTETWHEALPDEIWTGDQYALDLALSLGFPSNRLRLKANPLFVRLRRMVETAVPQSPPKSRILYLCEPVSRKLRATFGPEAAAYDDELVIMDQFLTCMERHASALEQVTLRLHPSEPLDKYDAVVHRRVRALRLRRSDEPTLAKDILSHTVVVGMESTALVVGIVLGKPVYSCLTGKPWAISLPHREVHHIHDFKQLLLGEKLL